MPNGARAQQVPTSPHSLVVDVSYGNALDDADTDPRNDRRAGAWGAHLAWSWRPVVGFETRIAVSNFAILGTIHDVVVGTVGARGYIPMDRGAFECGLSAGAGYGLMHHSDEINGSRYWTGPAYQFGVDWRWWHGPTFATQLGVGLLVVSGRDRGADTSWFLESEARLWQVGLLGGLVFGL